MVLLHVHVRWHRQSLAFLLSETQIMLCNHTSRSRVAAAGVAPSFRKHVFPKDKLPWRVCVALTCHSPSSRNMSKIRLVLLANGNALSKASAFCVYQ